MRNKYLSHVNDYVLSIVFRQNYFTDVQIILLEESNQVTNTNWRNRMNCKRNGTSNVYKVNVCLGWNDVNFCKYSLLILETFNFQCQASDFIIFLCHLYCTPENDQPHIKINTFQIKFQWTHWQSFHIFIFISYF